MLSLVSSVCSLETSLYWSNFVSLHFQSDDHVACSDTNDWRTDPSTNKIAPHFNNLSLARHVTSILSAPFNKIALPRPTYCHPKTYDTCHSHNSSSSAAAAAAAAVVAASTTVMDYNSLRHGRILCIKPSSVSMQLRSA